MFLENNNIKFISQYKFDTCKNKQKLPFDFAIFIDNKIFLIEYNGLQHYKPMGFGNKNENTGIEKLERTIKNDTIKLKWCQENRISLLIIPYLEFNNIEQKIRDFLFT